MNTLISGLQDYEANQKKYADRLATFTPSAPSADIFDLATSISQGLSAQKQTDQPNSIGGGFALGFNAFSQQVKKERDQYAKEKNQIALQAAQLAMQDEQKAIEFINDYEIAAINNANKELKFIDIEFDEEQEDGSIVRVIKPFENTGSNADVIRNTIKNKNGRHVTTPETQINMPDPSANLQTKSAIDSMEKDRVIYNTKAIAADATVGQVNEAFLLMQTALQEGRDAGQTDDEIFGPFSASTLKARELVVNLGFGGLLEAEGTVAPLKALNQLSMNFVMGIVSQTKGAISEKEMELFINASPTIGSTAEGFASQLQMLEKLATRDKKFYQDYLTEKGNLIKEGANPVEQNNKLQVFASQWREKNPFLTEKDIIRLNKAIKDPNFGEGFIPRDFKDKVNELKSKMSLENENLIEISTPKEWEALPSGTRYLNTKTGSIGRKI
tara:strand:+ start:3 stop:1331 length:1329 start_codon:yes stop_codon:yes gene_type:complete